MWELPGGVMLSEQQLQLLALAEEVRPAHAEAAPTAAGWPCRSCCAGRLCIAAAACCALSPLFSHALPSLSATCCLLAPHSPGPQVEKLQLEVDKQRSRNVQLEAQLVNAPQQQAMVAAAPGASASGPSVKKGRRRGYSLWQWIAGADVADAEAED